MSAACCGVATARTSANTIAGQEAVAAIVSSAEPMSSKMSTVALFAAATGEAMITSHPTGTCGRETTARTRLSLDVRVGPGEMSVVVSGPSGWRQYVSGSPTAGAASLKRAAGSYQGRICSSW